MKISEASVTMIIKEINAFKEWYAKDVTKSTND